VEIMSPQEVTNVAVAQAAYEASARGDWGAFMKLGGISDETEFHEAGSLPYGGTYRGEADIIRGATLMGRAWESFTFQVLGFCAGGDLVIAHVLISGIGRKTGKSFSMPVMEMWRFRDGKAIELRPFYWDTHRCVECFG
jgi:uncharacterized protein